MPLVNQRKNTMNILTLIVAQALIVNGTANNTLSEHVTFAQNLTSEIITGHHVVEHGPCFEIDMGGTGLESVQVQPFRACGPVVETLQSEIMRILN